MATESITVFVAARKLCADVLAQLNGLEVRYLTLEARRIELAGLPMVEASPYWHMETYLYLIHRTRDGYRPRKYIGKNQLKVQSALDSIERFQRHQCITQEIASIKTRVTEAQFVLQQCVRKLEDRGLNGDFH